ncbi:hypothetical protein EON65_51825 [archaeon]|nr:MAG: hypothetical protein EON65_51825 [archaeon]
MLFNDNGTNKLAVGDYQATTSATAHAQLIAAVGGTLGTPVAGGGCGTEAGFTTVSGTVNGVSNSSALSILGLDPRSDLSGISAMALMLYTAGSYSTY